MTNTVIKVENLSKQYRLGLVGTGSLGHDLNRWWAKLRGKPDPYLKIGEANDRTQKSDSEYVWALKDINFEVSQGEVLGIIGRNGAGKSTLLKILSRVTAPTTGNVKVKGRIASLLEVGTGFHPELTGRENIYLNGAINGMTKAEVSRKLDEIVDFSGCERYIDTPVKRYSSGMMVRLGFSVAAHLEPEILIVDEVLAVGDAEFQKKCIGKMQDVAGYGRTVLFVSHNMAAVESLCSHGIFLEKGIIIKSDEISSLIETYINSGTEAYSPESIRAIKRKTKTGRPWILDFSIYNKNRQQIQSIGVGESLKLNITIQPWLDVFSSKFAIGINDNFGKRLLTVATNLDPEFNFHMVKGIPINLSCEIPELLLTPGLYDFSIALTKQSELLDGLSNIGRFEVRSRDFFGTGVEVSKYQGCFVCKARWSM